MKSKIKGNIWGILISLASLSFIVWFLIEKDIWIIPALVFGALIFLVVFVVICYFSDSFINSDRLRKLTLLLVASVFIISYENYVVSPVEKFYYEQRDIKQQAELNAEIKKHDAEMRAFEDQLKAEYYKNETD